MWLTHRESACRLQLLQVLEHQLGVCVQQVCVQRSYDEAQHVSIQLRADEPRQAFGSDRAQELSTGQQVTARESTVQRLTELQRVRRPLGDGLHDCTAALIFIIIIIHLQREMTSDLCSVCVCVCVCVCVTSVMVTLLRGPDEHLLSVIRRVTSISSCSACVTLASKHNTCCRSERHAA